MPVWITPEQMRTKNKTMDFDLLKAHAINQPKEFLYSHPEYRLTIWEFLRLKYFVFLRKYGYSVATIVGHKEFYGLDFFVNKHVLIPRPDTEMMVAEVLNLKSEILNHKSILVDVGTGSGCIPIAILKTLKHKRIKTLAIDISRAALRVAKKNARTHNVNIEFLRGNLLQPINKNSIHETQIIITANLPYLTEKQFQDEPSIQREPKSALVADNSGLALYEELLQQIKFLPTPHNLLLLLEIDPSQTEAINKLITKYLPESKLEIKKDLSGLDRLVVINC